MDLLSGLPGLEKTNHCLLEAIGWTGNDYRLQITQASVVHLDAPSVAGHYEVKPCGG